MKQKIAIIGLGYVGLPLALEFSKKFSIKGFDINQQRINELKNGYDSTLESLPDELSEAKSLSFTSKINDLKNCNIYIITVPTPVDKNKIPDLKPLKNATKEIGKILRDQDIVIYESTVYPGATEEVCAPILEKESGLSYIKTEKKSLSQEIGFYLGYSPERINPGDKNHRLPDIKKVTSASTPDVAEQVDKLYKEIIHAGTYKAESIRVAEAAKVIENTQRDVNIALINELSLIFNKLEIDTEAVLKAAGTKWNFLPFRPGLVGGHCIGVDPYYLTHKAIEIGYNPEIILAGRRINDSMGRYVASQVTKLMTKKSIPIEDSNVLIMGFTFKENCPDIRNTRVIDIVDELKDFNCNVDVYDPWVNSTETIKVYDLEITKFPEFSKYDAIILAVAHDEFKKLNVNEIKEYGKENHVIYDLKYLFNQGETDGRL